MTKNIKKMIIHIMVGNEYLNYCKTRKENKKTLIEYKGELLNLRQAQTMFDNAELIDFKEHLAKIAKDDKKFNKWMEDMEDRCYECGFKPIKKEKLSKYHPDWKHYNKIVPETQIGRWTEDEPYCLCYMETCPGCGDARATSGGLDDNPEEGLRE